VTHPTPDAPNDPTAPRVEYWQSKYPTYADRAKAVDKSLGLDRGGWDLGVRSAAKEYEWNLAYAYHFGAFDPLRYQAAMATKDGIGSIHSNDPLMRRSNSEQPSVYQRAASYMAQYGSEVPPSERAPVQNHEVAGMMGAFARHLLGGLGVLPAPGVHAQSDPDTRAAPTGLYQGTPPPTAAPGVHASQQV